MKTYSYLRILQLPRLRWQTHDLAQLPEEVQDKIKGEIDQDALEDLLGKHGWLYHSKELTFMKDYLFRFVKVEEE